MKFFVTLLVFGFVSTSFAWTGVWNGGGGVVINGQPVTIGSVLLSQPEDNQLKQEQIPGMALLVKTIKSLNLSAEYESRVFDTILPSFNRAYYKMSEEELAGVKDQLIDVYADQLKTPKDQIALFAVTAYKGQFWPQTRRNVLLLPDFFKLKKESEQAAILFHEALWMLDRVDYNKVIGAEVLAQASMEHPENRDAFFYFVKSFVDDLLENHGQFLRVTFNRDVRDGVFNTQTKFSNFANDDVLHWIRSSARENNYRQWIFDMGLNKKSLFFKGITDSETYLLIDLNLKSTKAEDGYLMPADLGPDPLNYRLDPKVMQNPSQGSFCFGIRPSNINASTATPAMFCVVMQ